MILPTAELVASYANLPIPQAEPLIENSEPPPCPISSVPTDVLIDILKHVALLDPALFYRMSLVCRRFAYHFAHEQHVWKRLCQGWRFGFEAMHYSFACDIYGSPSYTLAPRYILFPREKASVQIPRPLSSWAQVFQAFPRIRFTGVYISTVNYTRPGAGSAYQNITWNSPIHIVTYFRYLRFYPDGTVISLLTTTEPTEVVPYINKENMLAAREMSHRQYHTTTDPGTTLSGATDPVPPITMATLRHALRGCWHLIRPRDSAPDAGDSATDTLSTSQCPSVAGDSRSPGLSDPRDIIIETEGVDPKYIYTMHLSLRSSSASKSSNPRAANNTAKNTKLAWKGFWSYNKLTDDWAEFALRNDKAYVFRRVRGWGME